MVRTRYYNRKREIDEVKKMAEKMAETSQARMKKIRPKKLEPGQRIWTSDELDSMSELEKEMHESVLQRKKEQTLLDYLDPLGIFDLNKHAANLQKEVQGQIDNTVNQLIVEPARQQWEQLMRDVVGEQHREEEHEHAKPTGPEQKGMAIEEKGSVSNEQVSNHDAIIASHDHHAFEKQIEFKPKFDDFV